jgi:VIT1/CCC1 family predicted Fe2+/Mn2+ transporter
MRKPDREQQARERLSKAHEPESIRRRIRERRGQGYTQDAVLGAIDGCVTTFAIVAGTIGGDFSPVVTVVLGMANLLADGFSMAASEYQATKAEGEEVDAARTEELRHIDMIPEAEREEIRQIYEEKGFRNDTLDKAVEATVSNRDTWVDTMLTDELGLQPLKRSSHRAGLVTFCAFVGAGFVPLLPFLFPRLVAEGHFLVSSVFTGVMFFAIGLAKGVVLNRPRIASALETLFTGIVAALLAYGAGALLKSLYGRAAV